MLALGVGLIGAALAPGLAVEAIVMLPIGAASTAFIATSNSILQLGSDPQMRGRVMALFSMVFLGTTPIGGPLIGWVAQRYGPRFALGVGAVATLLAGLVAALVLRRLRRSAARPAPQNGVASVAEEAARSGGLPVVTEVAPDASVGSRAVG